MISPSPVQLRLLVSVLDLRTWDPQASGAASAVGTSPAASSVATDKQRATRVKRMFPTPILMAPSLGAAVSIADTTPGRLHRRDESLDAFVLGFERVLAQD